MRPNPRKKQGFLNSFWSNFIATSHTPKTSKGSFLERVSSPDFQGILPDNSFASGSRSILPEMGHFPPPLHGWSFQHPHGTGTENHLAQGKNIKEDQRTHDIHITYRLKNIQDISIPYYYYYMQYTSILLHVELQLRGPFQLSLKKRYWMLKDFRCIT